MIIERRNNPTCVNPAALAARNHPFEFRLKSFKLRQAFAHICELFSGYRVHGRAILIRLSLQVNHFPNGRHGKAKITGMPYERQTLDGLVTIKALTTFAAIRIAHEADGFIVSNGCDFDARSL
jgi:hypothetical protein